MDNNQQTVISTIDSLKEQKYNLNHANKFTMVVGLTIILCLTTGCAYLSQISNDPRNPTQPEISRSFGTIIEDESIESKILTKLRREHPKGSHTIKVVSHNRIVLLAGKARDQKTIDAIVKIASSIPQVRQIQNEIEIGRQPTFANTLHDLWLTTKIKSKFIFTAAFPSQRVKVSTAQGTVFLMGLVNKQEAQQAIWIAKQARGTRKIITIFEYTTDIASENSTLRTARD